MKKLLLFLLAFPLFSIGQVTYPSQNISLLANWFDPNLTAAPSYNLKYNSVWGYAQGGKEYAIVGSQKGTYFIDVTNPSLPVQLDFVQGRRINCVWREYKTLGQYLYAVSDDASPNSLQIIDMSYLPDSVHVVYDSNVLVQQAHTIFIDGNKMYLAVPKGSFGGYSMAVYSLANPVQPVLLRTLDQDYPNISTVHDMLVRNDTVYASAAFDGLHIYRLTTSNTFVELGSFTSYPDAGYNHSSALTQDGKTLIFADEVPAKMKMKSIDVSDMLNITLLDTFSSGPVGTPHNPYIKGNDRLAVAYYKDGLQIFDISDPADVIRTGYFDTDPLDNGSSSEYQGAWGAYIDLPSGNILVSDMQNGLFILDASQAMSIKIEKPKVAIPVVYPVPFNDELKIDFEGRSNNAITFNIYDMTGKLVLSEESNIIRGVNKRTLPTSNLRAGMYLLRFSDGHKEHSRKIVKY